MQKSSVLHFLLYLINLLLSKVLREVRKHENVGVFTSEGERSMLSSFKEVAKKLRIKMKQLWCRFINFTIQYIHFSKT